MCSCDQSLITVAFLWEKLSQPQFYKDLTGKIAFFEGWSWFKFHNLGLALGTNLKFYTSEAKGLKLKVRKFSELISTFVEVTGEELVVVVVLAFFCPPPPPSWIGFKTLNMKHHLLINKISPKVSPKTLQYWVGIQRGQSYILGRRCLFSLGWQPF